MRKDKLRKSFGEIMEDNRQEQLEALEVLKEFNERILKNIPILIRELSGERLMDTDKFLKGVIDAMNWEIQVVNGTMDLLNEGKERINKEEFNEKVVAVSDAVVAKDDMAMAKAFEAITPYFEKLGEAVNEIIK